MAPAQRPIPGSKRGAPVKPSSNAARSPKLLSQKIGGSDANTRQKDIASKEPPKTSVVKLRHIFCHDQSKASEALVKIQNGQRFDIVAQQYSEDAVKEKGISAWMTRNAMTGPFRDAAFELQPSTLDNPILSPLVKTSAGYHIILVEDRR